MSLPQLSPERLEQMVHLACSYKQDEIALPWYQRALKPLQNKSAGFSYGLGAVALSLSCAGAFWLVSGMSTPQENSNADFSVTEYIMQDLMDDLTQPALNPDISFQA